MMSPRELAGLLRKGAKLRPQCKVTMFRDGESCALGAIAEGYGVKFEEGLMLHHLPMDLFNSLFHNTKLGEEIYIRNDGCCGHQPMSREQIADWLETLDTAKQSDADAYAQFRAVLLSPVEVEA